MSKKQQQEEKGIFRKERLWRYGCIKLGRVLKVNRCRGERLIKLTRQLWKMTEDIHTKKCFQTLEVRRFLYNKQDKEKFL